MQGGKDAPEGQGTYGDKKRAFYPELHPDISLTDGQKGLRRIQAYAVSAEFVQYCLKQAGNFYRCLRTEYRWLVCCGWPTVQEG